MNHESPPYPAMNEYIWSVNFTARRIGQLLQRPLSINQKAAKRGTNAAVTRWDHS